MKCMSDAITIPANVEHLLPGRNVRIMTYACLKYGMSGNRELFSSWTYRD